ncbi:hypothetical protein BRD00_01650 [Halobacteriales archaeon QS_8_69_26]|nr:MAG: hypothetical protein BRD00_01650 [Halobacteriales archaeon QS_8_69_26]
MDETRTRPAGSGGATRVGRSLAVVAALLAVTALASVGGAAAGVADDARTGSVEGGIEAGTTASGEWATLDGGSHDSGDAEVVDDGTYFIGQVLWTEAFDPGDDVTLRRADGTLVTEVPVGEDGAVTLQTSSRVPGKYVLRSPTGPEIGFELVTQEFRVSAPPSVASNGTGTTATFLVESNREQYRQVVASPQLSGAELASLFGAGNRTDVDDDGEEELVLDGGIETELTADFTGFDPGTYTFTFDVADAAATDSVTVEVLGDEPGRAFFVSESGVVVEERGDVVRIPLAFENAERATLTVGSDRTGWAVSMTVVDADDDGAVAVLFNTDLAGRVEDPALAFEAAGGDRVESVTRTAGQPFSDPDRRLAAGAYPLFLSVEGEGSAVATIQLREPDAVDRSVRVAPAPARLSERAVVENATAGNLPVGSNVTVATGDYAVVELGIAGVFGALAVADDPSDTPAGVSLRIMEVGPNRNDEADTVDPRNFSIVPLPRSNMILLVADAGHPDFEENTTYQVSLTVTRDNPYVDTTVSRSANFRVVPRRVSVDAPDDGVRVSAVEDGTIGGTTTAADGTRLAVTVRSDGTGADDAQPFLRSKTVVVEDGTWSATFDFSTVPTGQEFTVVVAGAGTPARADGVVTRPPAVRIEDQTPTNPQIVTVEHARLPEGGFVTVHDASPIGRESSTVLGSSGYLPPGDHVPVRITLEKPLAEDVELAAVVHRDTDRDRRFDFVRSGGAVDAPYAVGGDPVADVAQVSIGRTPTTTPGTTGDAVTPTATATPTEDPTTLTSTPTETPTGTPTETGTTTADGSGDGDGAPGFRSVVALLAVLVAALLGIRRRQRQ